MNLYIFLYLIACFITINNLNIKSFYYMIDLTYQLENIWLAIITKYYIIIIKKNYTMLSLFYLILIFIDYSIFRYSLTLNYLVYSLYLIYYQFLNLIFKN